MAKKFYITNGDKYIGGNTKSFMEVCGTSNNVLHFTFQNAQKFIADHFADDPNWTIQKVFSTGSGRRYVVTNATGYVGKSRVDICTKRFENAKAFRSVADAEAYIRNTKKLRPYFPNPIIIDETLKTYERSPHKEFTDEQLNALGIATTKRATKRIQFDESLKRKVYERSNGKCEFCKRDLEMSEATIDHIDPLSRGGDNDPSNLRCLCPDCNQMKGRLKDDELKRSMVGMIAEDIYKNPYNDGVNILIRGIVRGRINLLKNGGIISA